jgi:hypothetical protein
MDAYTLKEKKDTREYHLFKGTFTQNGCTSKEKSICEKMDKSESIRNVFTCQDEDTTRLNCANIGREVCGICISHLYSTYE